MTDERPMVVNLHRRAEHGVQISNAFVDSQVQTVIIFLNEFRKNNGSEVHL